MLNNGQRREERGNEVADQIQARGLHIQQHEGPQSGLHNSAATLTKQGFEVRRWPDTTRNLSNREAHQAVSHASHRWSNFPSSGDMSICRNVPWSVNFRQRETSCISCRSHTQCARTRPPNMSATKAHCMAGKAATRSAAASKFESRIETCSQGDRKVKRSRPDQCAQSSSEFPVSQS